MHNFNNIFSIRHLYRADVFQIPCLRKYLTEAPDKSFIKLHSNTSKEQGLFIQEMFELAKPSHSIEVGMAYGISTLFILEKHNENNNDVNSHTVIEPFPWGGVAEHNIKRSGLTRLVDIHYQKSDLVLPKLFYKGLRVQFGYIDTTKVFDTVLQDFYFIDKMMDVNGIIVFDDCGGYWPGVQRVARFVNTLPHYKLVAKHSIARYSKKKKIAAYISSFFMKIIPFKKHLYSSIDMRTDVELGLNYNCLAFQKTGEDSRDWKWDKAF